MFVSITLTESAARQITTYMTERGEGINTIHDSPKDPKIARPPKPLSTNY